MSERNLLLVCNPSRKEAVDAATALAKDFNAAGFSLFTISDVVIPGVTKCEVDVMPTLEVADSAYDVGLGTLGIAASPLPGPAGNVEYFLWLRRGAPEINHEALDQAIAIGPQ